MTLTTECVLDLLNATLTVDDGKFRSRVKCTPAFWLHVYVIKRHSSRV